MVKLIQNTNMNVYDFVFDRIYLIYLQNFIQ